MNFHRMPFVILSAVVLVLGGSLTYFWKIYEEPTPPEYTWGWGSPNALLLNLTLERNNISINATLNFTATLKNIGSERLRIYPWEWRPNITVYHDGFEVKAHLVPTSEYPRPSDKEFNRMLVVLGPNGTYSRQGYIKNDTSWGDSWELQEGFNYSVKSMFRTTEVRNWPSLPRWFGWIMSNTEEFSVLP